MQSGNEIWAVFAILQNNSTKLYQKNSTKYVAWKLVPGPFQFSKNPL